MSRAVWKGALLLGDISVGLKLHSAVTDERVHFRMLHAKDLSPIYQKLEDPKTGKVYEYSDAQKGLVLGNRSIAVLSKAELESLEEPSEKEFKVLCSLPLNAVDHIWIQRPYFLSPDESEVEYTALVESLRKAKSQLLVSWAMRKRRYQGVIRVSGDALVLLTLHSADEVVQLPEVGNLDAGIKAKELKMAESLIEALSGNLDLEKYGSTYKEDVLAYISAKAAGKTVRLKKPKEKKEPKSVADMLEASLRRVSGG